MTVIAERAGFPLIIRETGIGPDSQKLVDFFNKVRNHFRQTVAGDWEQSVGIRWSIRKRQSHSRKRIL